MNRNIIIFFVIVTALLSLFYWPIFRWLVNSWESSDYYSHGILVPLVSGFIIWAKNGALRWNRLTAVVLALSAVYLISFLLEIEMVTRICLPVILLAPILSFGSKPEDGVKPSILGTLILMGGVFLYLFSFILDTRWIGGLSLIFVLTGLSFSFLGIHITRKMAFPLVFLTFMIPPPFIQDLGFELQKISATNSTWLLDLVLSATQEGPKIYIEGISEPFFVDVVCGGVNSFVALVALGAVYVYVLKGPVLNRAALLILAGPIAILSNTLRITSIVLVAHYLDEDFARGSYHDISSPLFFIIAFGLMLLLGWLLRCKFNINAFEQ